MVCTAALVIKGTNWGGWTV